MTAEAQGKVNAMSAKMKGYFEGQNNSAVRALTLHMDETNGVIRIQVFDPTSDLVMAIPGTGMKTAFTQEPINFVTAQNGTGVSIYKENGERDILSAALAIANAMEVQFGVNAMSATLGDILALSSDVRTMQFMFGCSDTVPAETRDYNATYTLKFEEAPIRFAPESRAQTLAVGQTVTLTPIVTITGTSLIWSSSNTAVATVADGVVTGVGDGVATISVTADGVLMPAQAKITVLGANTVFTYGYSPSDLKVPSGLTESAGNYKGNIDLPVEGDESALYIKMPNVDGVMTVHITNSMGTFTFANSVTLKNTVLKIPSKIIRDAYEESNYALYIEVSGVTYTMRFNNTNGVIPSPKVPVVNLNSLVGAYTCGEKKLYVAEINGTMQSFLPGDTGWGNVVVSDGIRNLDSNGEIVDTSVKMGYSDNAQIAPNANYTTLSITKTKGLIGIVNGEIYTRSGDATIGAACESGYWFSLNSHNDKFSKYEKCTCVTVNGHCPRGMHFTVCTDPACTDPTHIVLCGLNSQPWPGAPIVPCPAYHLHADKDKPCRNVEEHTK